MRYKAGKVGRVVLARFDHGEQVVPSLAGLCEKEGEVFVVVEAMIFEVLGVRVTRSPDERSGLELLTLE